MGLRATPRRVSNHIKAPGQSPRTSIPQPWSTQQDLLPARHQVHDPGRAAWLSPLQVTHREDRGSWKENNLQIEGQSPSCSWGVPGCQGEPSQGTAGTQEHPQDTAENSPTSSAQALLGASISFYRAQGDEWPSAIADTDD